MPVHIALMEHLLARMAFYVRQRTASSDADWSEHERLILVPAKCVVLLSLFVWYR
jgi:hypothetical protein